MANIEVDDAFRGLQGAVKQFCRKYQKRFRGTEGELEVIRKHIAHLMQHAEHVLRQLTIKRVSLQQAVSALQESWNDYRSTLKESKLHNLRAVLQHLLQHYLRIGDGMVLLESGECRHAGDYPTNNYRYKSHLTKNQVRGDGYTVLYSKDLKYSGFGWDEFFDDQFGVQARLLRALQKLSGKSTTTIWEILLETGCQLFESSFDAHETDVQAVRKALEGFRDTVKRDLLQLLHQFGGGGGKVHFATQDKMEFIDVKMRKQVAGISSFKLQRRGDEFQVKDKEGVLPEGWSRVMWKKHMELSSRIKRVVVTSDIVKKTAAMANDEHQPVKKRRRVIEDSSDEEEEDGGFHVRENKIQDVETKDMSSLNAIKSDLGVNASELETALEGLEAEQQVKPKAESEQTEVDHDIQTSRARVKRLRKVLHRVLNDQDDPLEVWDAREHLRQETMQLGNDLLEVQSMNSSQHLLDAKAYFEEATELVQEQEALHKLIVEDTNDDTEGAWLMQRNLLLLKGRTQTNNGVALLALSLIPKAPLATRKKYRLDAMKELSLAEKCASDLRARAVGDKHRGASTSEAAMDMIKAAQLEALALRSRGSTLWHDGKQAVAIEVFQDAACTYQKIEKWVMVYVEEGADFLAPYLTNLVECYFSSITLFDLAEAKIERLQMIGSDAANSRIKGKDLVATASNAVERAKPVIALIKKLAGKSPSFSFEDVLIENGLPEEDDIDAALADLNHRWKQRADNKALPGKALPSTNQKDEVPRNDLGVGMLTIGRSSNGPKRSFIISDVGRAQRSRKNPGANKGSVDFAYNSGKDKDETVQLSSLPVVYMKWGDELLSETGEDQGPLLQYPACAPPRPANFSLQYMS